MTFITQERMNVIHKESLCINCGCCVSECNSMESDPHFTGPQALAKAMRFVGDPRDGHKLERLEALNGEHGLWACTRCYFCSERCPKGVDPRDAIAKLGAESMKEGIDRDMGAKHAKWFVTSAKTTGWLRETELVPKTQGVVAAIKQTRFALDLVRHGKVPPPFPPHVAKDVGKRAGCTTCARPGSRRLRRHRPGREGAGAPRARARRRLGVPRGDLLPRRRVPAAVRPRDRRGEDLTATATDTKRVAYYKGCLASLSAKELDSATQALAPKVGLELVELESVTCCGAGDIHEAEPDYYLHLNARILSYAAAEGVDTLLTVCNVCTLNLRQANFILLGDTEVRARVNENLVAVGVPAYERDIDVRHLLWEVAEGPGYEKLKVAAHRGLRGLKIAPFYGCQILRPSKIQNFEDPGPAVVARADHRGLRRRGDRLPGEDQVLRLPDHSGARGDGAR